MIEAVLRNYIWAGITNITRLMAHDIHVERILLVIY